MSGLGYIQETLPAKCELCGKIAELRPYGPNRENICYECGQKNIEITEARIAEHIFGVKYNETL